MKLLITLLVSLLLFSCSPARRIERLCRKHPEICKNDTVINYIYLTTPSVDTTLIADTSGYQKLDSVLLSLKDTVLREVIRTVYRTNTKTLFAKPQTITTSAYKATLWQDDRGNLRVKIEGLKVKVKTFYITKTVTVTPRITFAQKITQGMYLCLATLILLIISTWVFRALFRRRS